MSKHTPGFGAHSDQERILAAELHRFVGFKFHTVAALARNHEPTESIMSSPALYWKSQDMQMAGVNFNDLLGMAQMVMKDLGMTSVKKTQADVSGRTANGHSAITFFHIGNSWIAVIMSAGDDAKVVRKKLSDALDKLVTL